MDAIQGAKIRPFLVPQNHANLNATDQVGTSARKRSMSNLMDALMGLQAHPPRFFSQSSRSFSKDTDLFLFLFPTETSREFGSWPGGAVNLPRSSTNSSSLRQELQTLQHMQKLGSANSDLESASLPLRRQEACLQLLHGELSALASWATLLFFSLLLVLQKRLPH